MKAQHIRNVLFSLIIVMSLLLPPRADAADCASRTQGDADCDGSVTVIDFEVFRREYTGESQTTDADFDADGAVSIADFEIWRQGYFAASPTVTQPSATPTQSSMKIYYVSPSGNDGNPGTVDRPFRTISKAVTVVKAGETVSVRAGTYRESITIAKGGTSSSRVVLQANPGEAAVIDGTGLDLSNKLPLLQTVAGANFVTISGLSFKNSNGRGVTIASNNVRIKGCSISAIYNQGISARGTDSLEVLGCDISDTNRVNAAHDGILNWGSAISIWESTNALVQGNTVHNNHGEGINSWRKSEGSRIIGNVVYDNYSTDIYLDGSRNSAVEKNVIYETETAYKPWGNGASEKGRARELAIGVSISQEDYTGEDPTYSCEVGGNRLVGNVVRNNVIVNTRVGINFYKDMPCVAWKNIMIENNTVVGTWDDGIRLWAADHSGNMFRNNILYPKQGNIITIDQANDTKFQNNILYSATVSPLPIKWNGKTMRFADWNALANNTGNAASNPLFSTSDPLFTSARAVTAGEYRIKPGSPTIDGGSSLSAVAEDIFGTARPVDGNSDGRALMDIGAHEFGQ